MIGPKLLKTISDLDRDPPRNEEYVNWLKWRIEEKMMEPHRDIDVLELITTSDLKQDLHWINEFEGISKI